MHQGLRQRGEIGSRDTSECPLAIIQGIFGVLAWRFQDYLEMNKRVDGLAGIIGNKSLLLDFYCIFIQVMKSTQSIYGEKIIQPQDLPIQEKDRKSTDTLCTIIGAIFALTMFIAACIMWNRGSFDHLLNFHSHHKSHLMDSSITHNLVTPYSQHAHFGMHHEGENSYRDYEGFKTTLGWGMLVAVGFGLCWMVLVHCVPRMAPQIALVGAAILVLAIAVLLFIASWAFWGEHSTLKIILGIICVLLFLILIFMLISYSKEVRFQGFLLEYAVRFLNENPATFAYIPLFMILALGLVALITWQHCCYTSQSGGYFWNWAKNVWQVLNILEFIWGLSFLRDAFNYCVSGSAAHWYYGKKVGMGGMCKQLLCNHWGSVVAGSFLNAFFELPTLVAELLICHPNTCCSKCGSICFSGCSCCTCFFNLVRTDAYSYMALSGVPFCNSARSCEKICSDSKIFVGSHSPMKHYRFAAHVLCVAAVALMTYFILKYRVDDFNFWHLAIGIALIYAAVTWFINIHADSAEGIQTAFLVERNTDDYAHMQNCKPSFRKEFMRSENDRDHDGFCCF